jgi:hypothetical protein
MLQSHVTITCYRPKLPYHVIRLYYHSMLSSYVIAPRYNPVIINIIIYAFIPIYHPILLSSHIVIACCRPYCRLILLRPML